MIARVLVFCFSLHVAACKFEPSGAPLGPDVDGAVDDVDGGTETDGGTEPDASPDATVCPSDQVTTPAGCQPRPRIVCAAGSMVGKRQLNVGGWITTGLLDDAPVGATPSYIAYGSDFDSSAINGSCTPANRWVIPYPPGCTAKPTVAWSGEGTDSVMSFEVSDGVENFNIAVVYADDTVRWADIKLDDGDPDGFTVSGSGSGYSCHIVHPNNIGGYIQVAP